MSRLEYFSSVGLLLLLGGCNPYERITGEFNAGAVDPYNFPPPYRRTAAYPTVAGAAGTFTRQTNGSGIFVESGAFANNAPANYFRFDFQTAPTAAPVIRLSGNPVAAAATPNSYNFDTLAANKCQKPPGYQYDELRDDVHYDDQGNLFTGLPAATFATGALPAWNYIPVVTEIPIAANNQPCQGIKTEKTVKANATVGAPSGRFLAWALIDPGSPVFRVGQPTSTGGMFIPDFGLSAQKYGWYEHFLVVYLDGGVVPTLDTMVMSNPAVQIRAQRILIPRSTVIEPRPGGGSAMVTGGDLLGRGYDVLEFERTEPMYSPLCQVFTYCASGTGATCTGSTAVASSALPRSLAGIQALAMGGSIAAAAGTVPTFIWCLQVQ